MLLKWHSDIFVLLFHSLKEFLFFISISFCQVQHGGASLCSWSTVSSNRPRGCVCLYFTLRPLQPDHIFRKSYACSTSSGPSDWEVINLFLWQPRVNINPPTLQWHSMVGIQFLATGMSAEFPVFMPSLKFDHDMLSLCAAARHKAGLCACVVPSVLRYGCHLSVWKGF